jgi:hypothetical protein
MPPPWGPRRFARYLRWAWLVEGGAQYFSGQTGSFRTAMLRRLSEGSRPSFPPSARDAIILGGSVLDLLDDEVGPHACELLVSRLPKAGPEAALETAFGAPVREIEPLWREHVAALAGPAPRA